MGMASTAPAYSLASALGFVVATVALQSPIIMLLAFVPMYMIAVAYKELNEAEPDCGTTFTWAARAFGASWGWMGGWGIFAADVIVMANLAQIAGSYGYLLVGADSLATSNLWVTVAGDHLDHRHDLHLVDRDRDLGQAPVSAAGHRGGHPRPSGRYGAGEGVLGNGVPESHRISLSWFNPFDISSPGCSRRESSPRCSSTGAGIRLSPVTRRPPTRHIRLVGRR